MNLKQCTTTLLSAAILSTLTLSHAQAATTIRLSTYVNESDIRYDGFVKFAELIGEKSEGRIKVELFPSSTLHGWSEGVDAVQGGVADISWVPADSRLPCYRATSLYPAAIDLSKQTELDAAFTELLADEAEQAGLVSVFNSNYTYDQEWWFEKPDTDLGKLDGQLVRSIGPLVSMMIEAWGGQPVFVAPKEVFQSAERGVVDGINMGVATYSSWKLWSVMPHMINADLFYGNIQYMMNKRKFDGLSAADQQAVLEAGRETEVWLKPQYEAWVDQRVGNAVMAGGGSARSLSAEKRDSLIDSVQGDWDKEVDKACGVELANSVRELFKAHAL